MRVDLHLHSTASDGRLSPAELVHLAARQELGVIAITDHDSIEGIIPALMAAHSFPLLKVIPGVEISTDVPHGEVHILGYFIDYSDAELQRALERMRNSRRGRAQKMLVKLQDSGINIEWNRVQELAGDGSIGRPHIAQAMLERGYISSVKEAFDRYIGRDGPAYVEREKMTPEEAVELVVRSGGLPVLAHPADFEDLDELLSNLKVAGLVGIEAYYNGYTPDTIRRLVNVANKRRLILTGGSDYHGLGSSDETLPGGVDVPEECVERLVALAGQRGLELIAP